MKLPADVFAILSGVAFSHLDSFNKKTNSSELRPIRLYSTKFDAHCLHLSAISHLVNGKRTELTISKQCVRGEKRFDFVFLW